jgi:hypothetical protein
MKRHVPPDIAISATVLGVARYPVESTCRNTSAVVRSSFEDSNPYPKISQGIGVGIDARFRIFLIYI